MVIDIECVKGYLRIDFDDDDEYIKLLIEVAKEYIDDAVGEYNEENARHNLILLNIISSLYENRSFTNKNQSEKVSYSIKNMLMQLQLEGD